MNRDCVRLLGLPPGELFARRKELALGLLSGGGAGPGAGEGPAGLLPDGLRPAAGFDPGRAVCLTLLAGAGTRWVKSLAEAKARPELRAGCADFPLDAPRGLFPVADRIGAGGGTIPMASYALDAFRGLGRQLIVVRGWEREIVDRILSPLGIRESGVQFRTQAPGPGGKVLGHGDAVLQAMDLWRDAKYVLVNFGGDANSPLTALLSRLFIEGLEGTAGEADLVLPVARMEGAAYPIYVDEEGRPRAFGHDKLGGKGASGRDGGDREGLRPSGFTNVGLRAYRGPALAEAMLEFRRDRWKDGIGWEIPGNDPAGREFALDNVDALLAGRGRARLLPVAAPEELAPAKSFDELPRFEAAVRKVRADWDEFRGASASDAREPPYRRP